MSTDTNPEAWLADMAKMGDEPLDADLADYLEDGSMGRMLRHPLVYEIPLILPGYANRQYRQKKRLLTEAIQRADWHTVVFLHERPYRTRALLDYVVGTDQYDEPLPLSSFDQDVRDLAADVWVDSENLEQHEREWRAMFVDPDGLVLGSEAERGEFAAMPDTLTLYRGDIEDGGWSWSLDPKIAYFFAHRWDANDPLVSGTVEKRHVFGYLSRRGESEVLVERKHVQNVQPFDYTPPEKTHGE